MNAVNSAGSGIVFALTAGLFGLVFNFIPLVPEAKATVAQVSGDVEPVQGDVSGFLRNPSCLEKDWPNNDASCLFDMRPDSEGRTIRVIDLTKRDVRSR
jgi:hypothetical protein